MEEYFETIAILNYLGEVSLSKKLMKDINLFESIDKMSPNNQEFAMELIQYFDSKEWGQAEKNELDDIIRRHFVSKYHSFQNKKQ